MSETRPRSGASKSNTSFREERRRHQLPGAPREQRQKGGAGRVGVQFRRRRRS
jgi:hypothetical protein